MILRLRTAAKSIFSLRKFCDKKTDPGAKPEQNKNEAPQQQINLDERPFSLSEEQIIALSTSKNYIQATEAMNLHHYRRSLNLFLQTEKQIATNYDQLINLRIFLMNRKSIVQKLLGDPGLAITLRQIFFFNVAYKGYLSPDTNKHLGNALLASIYNDRKGVLALVEHLKDEAAELSPMCKETLSFYSSIAYAMDDQTIGKAMEQISSFEMNDDNQVALKNNLAWISIWANLHAKPQQKKQSILQSLQLFREAFKDAENTSNPYQIAFKRQTKDLFMPQFLLDAKLQKKSAVVQQPERVKLVNKMSHILCMNMGEMHFILRNTEQASFWLQLCMQHANKMGSFDRVIRAMTLTGNILQLGGFDKPAERIYLDILLNGTSIPQYSRRYTLLNYIEFLHKRLRFYESMGYSDQLMNFDPNCRSMQRLEGLILPDYDFSY